MTNPQIDAFDQQIVATLPTKPGDKKVWHNLFGSGLAQSIAAATATHPGLVLVITQDSMMADRLEQHLRFFLGQSEPAFNTEPSQQVTTSDCDIMHFPDWETLPYDNFSPHQDIISERLLTLHKLPLTKKAVLITPVTTLMHRLAPPSYISANSLILDCGQSFSIRKVRQHLETVGYICVDSVNEHGEFAVRGSIIDIFPMGSTCPYRIELFDDEIESLRSFDPETQRTIDQVEHIRLLPAREYPLDKPGIDVFKDTWHEQFDVEHRACPIYNDVSDAIASAGLEYYLPLFFTKTSNLFDYIPDNTLIFTTGAVDSAISRFWQEINDRYEQRAVDNRRPILPPHQVFLPVDEIHGALNRYPRIICNSEKTDHSQKDQAGHTRFSFLAPPALTIDAKAANPYARVEDFILADKPRHILFCAESAGRREAMLEMLSNAGIKPTPVDNWQRFIQQPDDVCITVAPIDEGLFCQTQDIALVAESQLYGQRVMQRRRRKQERDNTDNIFKNLTELKIGSAVVHIDHGVGRYLGLQNITVDGDQNEFLTLQYADEATLYVPVASLHLISRYSGAEQETAPLHRLGSEQWQKAKRKAAEKIRDVAAELLNVYARRAAVKGLQFNINEQEYQRFASSFVFEETQDQENSINAVLKDMATATPMDRLICGDVGFGKTEVAMRAAFVCVHAGKQVALLVPTTLLAQQHFETLRDRFADWPVRIELMSRFRSNKEIIEVQKGLANGQVDIVVGTHKLIQKDNKYNNLGLVIIDEEHRFGVRQKDVFKSLRSEVDILTLTATPIPRTLNMSMSGMRDISIIATPPAKRLSIKTFVRSYEQATAKEAIQREILRGGQVYYLHNEVKDIEKVARDLEELVPEARVGIGHGQLRERELEQIMSDFYHKKINILVCTTIIETGIDIPNANTIIIDRADKFGLAQLHQLRGRVGRSHHQAYAYLFTPHPRNMTTDAIKRLEAISEATDLGSGFTLATHDLEIRGAGELLGDEQSGQIHTIGYTLYMDMLEQAINAIKSGEIPNLDKPLHQGSEINLRLCALIPDDYLPDVHGRLIMYKRIANASNKDELEELQVEMIDRFGLLPDAIKNLFQITELKFKANLLGIEKIEASSKGGRIEFNSNTIVDPMNIVNLVQKQPQTYQFEGATTLKFKQELEQAQPRIQAVADILQRLDSG